MFLGGLVFFLSLASANDSLPLQMGETWDRETIKNVSDSRIKNLANSVGRVEVVISQTASDKVLEVGTAFVVGQRGTEFIIATNYHVMPKKRPCSVYFTTLGATENCKSFLGAWKDLELTLFTVSSKKLKPNHILEIESDPVQRGYKLMTMGYGYYQNKSSRLTVERSEYCRVISKNMRFVSANSNFGAFSFAHACEISTSDSGAPIFDAETGRVVGIQWAATVREKGHNVVDESILDDMLLSSDQNIWSGLNYAVPGQFIAEKVRYAVTF